MTGLATRWWPLLRRVLGWTTLLLVLGSVVMLGMRLDWTSVGQALRAIAPQTLLLAALLAAANHLIYSAFDLLGRSFAGLSLSRGRVLAITFVSYVATLNFGALIGAVALRQRLYAHAGLSLKAISQIFALSVATNWLGYLLLAGLLLVGPTSQLVEQALMPAESLLRLVGIAILAFVATYLLACWRLGGGPVKLGGIALRMPHLDLALAQVLLSALSWLVNNAIVYVLLGGEVRFDVLLAVSLLAAVAGLILHIPAGIGVLEGVFVLMLGAQVAPETLIACLLVYRAVFYLLPLPVAGVLWFLLETERGVSRRTV